MPPVTGSYSKNIRGGYDEAERLQLGLVRRAIPIVDADENKKEFIRYTWLRRALETVIGDASPNNGFKIEGDGAVNDFKIKGGDGTFDGAGRMWVRGLHAFLKSDIRYVNSGTTADELACLSTITAITGVGNITLEDSAASWVPGSLVGRTVTPDVSGGFSTAILSNTANTLTVGVDLVASGAAVGDRYRVNLSTPGAPRNDGVYLNVSIDEVDGADLPSILHDLGTLMAAQYFIQVRHILEVHQGDASGLPGSLATSYTDLDGFEHFRVKLADIARPAISTIAALDVTDRRITSANFSTFLKKIGDNMSGDLNMLAGADITLAAGGTVDGRDLSVDGAKLDTITWTGPGVAALLPKTSTAVKGTTLVGQSTASRNVSQYLRDREPGGSTTATGVITSAPDNKVILKRALDADDLVDADLNKAFGRLTEAHPFPSISGTWTFTNASFSVLGSGGNAVVELQVGDIIKGPDNLYYTVGVIVGANSLTLVEPFAGTTGPTISPTARRWTLSLVRNQEGTETSFAPSTDAIVPGAVDIDWYWHEVFTAATKPVIDPAFSVAADQVAPEIPTATTAITGKVRLAADLGTTAGQAVQASDTRLGRVKGRVGLTLSDLKGEVELVAGGGGISVGISQTGDKVIFTITNTLPGGGASFPGFGTSAPGADAGSGSAGSSGLAADHGHVHPLSNDYKMRTKFSNFSGSSAPSVNPGFTPRFVFFGAAISDGPAMTYGVATSTAAADQGSIVTSGTLNLGQASSGNVMFGGSTTFAVSTFTSANVATTRTAGAGTVSGFMVVLGDNLAA